MTKSKIVTGMAVTETSIREAALTVRVTVDGRGASMSLADDEHGLMLSIPLEPVAELVQPSTQMKQWKKHKKSIID